MFHERGKYGRENERRLAFVESQCGCGVGAASAAAVVEPSLRPAVITVTHVVRVPISGEHQNGPRKTKNERLPADCGSVRYRTRRDQRPRSAEAAMKRLLSRKSTAITALLCLLSVLTLSRRHVDVWHDRHSVDDADVEHRPLSDEPVVSTCSRRSDQRGLHQVNNNLP